MSTYYRSIALSNHPLARAARAAFRLVMGFSLPAPRWLIRPFVVIFLVFRMLYYFLFRVVWCEPFFKSHCSECGHHFHTGAHVHWIQGEGKLIVGDNVTIDGKCSFVFAVRYVESPTLRIGNHVVIGHGSAFTVGREIKIGNNVMIAGGVSIFDSPGHPVDPILRRQGNPALPEDVKPILIEDDVWIGQRAVIFPGTAIGQGSVVAAGAVVMSNVPAYAVVAGNPARQIARIPRGSESK